MGIPDIRNTPSAFGPSDFLLSKTNQSICKLDIPREFRLDSPSAPSLDGKGVPDTAVKSEDEDLRKAFQDFVGQTLFSQMISSMRSTQDGAAYFDGGRAEKIFQGQLDQVLSEELSKASASKISDPMFKLFQLRRQ